MTLPKTLPRARTRLSFLYRTCQATLLCCAAGMHAQTVPADAGQLRAHLVEARRIAALESSDGAPFVLTASFQTFDYKGQPAGDGTLEETWLKPGVSRRVIHFRGQVWTQVASDGAARTSSDDSKGSIVERRIVHALLNAVPAERDLPPANQLEYKKYKAGTVVLDCALTKADNKVNAAALFAAEAARTAYCMTPDTHMLRIVQERFDFDILYNQLARLGGHTIARSIVMSQNGIPRARLTVDTFRGAPELKLTDFPLPGDPSGSEAEDPPSLPGAVVTGLKISGKNPIYPDEAKQRRISGSVVMAARINEEGGVEDVDVVSSPSPILTESAISTVKTWRYKPYLLNGKPTSVDTTLTVNYSFSH